MRWDELATTFPTLAASLRAMVRNRSWGQAYLFQGDAPDFLKEAALVWLSACACPVSARDGLACGVCPDCHTFAAGSYPELNLLQPSSKTRKIPVDAVREFERRLGLTAATGRLKIGLVCEVDRMNDQSQNAFLKTLEEPPTGTLLVLTSANPRQLLPTIRSRCQTVRLLRNRQEYGGWAERGLFTALTLIRPGAGAASGLAGAHRIGSLLAGLHAEAEALAKAAADPNLAAQAVLDPALRKKVEEELAVRIEAEYQGLRQELIATIGAWFQQRVLLAAGAPPHTLPHPEMLAAASDPAAAPPLERWEEADRTARLAGELAWHLAGNIEERLCLEAFCLAATNRTATMG